MSKSQAIRQKSREIECGVLKDNVERGREREIIVVYQKVVTSKTMWESLAWEQNKHLFKACVD